MLPPPDLSQLREIQGPFIFECSNSLSFVTWLEVAPACGNGKYDGKEIGIKPSH
jgi:hypothetical protein